MEHLLNLAIATVGVAYASEGENGFHRVSVNISRQVSDYARARGFYGELLGMKVAKDDGKPCYLVFGDTHLVPRHGRNAANVPRIDHIADTISDRDRTAVEAGLKRRGLPPRPDEETSFIVKDLDGMERQICSKDMKP